MAKIKKFNEEVEKQKKLFEYLISLGFDKLFLKDTSNKSVRENLIIFRHNEFYRESLLAFTIYESDEIYIDYYNVKKFLDIWGYLNDEELDEFQDNFLS
jgi:hypothetical protein